MNYTTTAEARRPSPRPRPEGAGSRPDGPQLRVVPDSEMPTSGSEEVPPAETITAGQSGSPTGTGNLSSDSGFRLRFARAWTSTTTYWTPPALFTQPPATLNELRNYATTGPWTQQPTGLFRTAGTTYYRLIGYPATVCCRYWEWVWQRPGRAAAHLAAVKILAHTSPGIWLVDHLITPAAHYAGHIFL